MPPLFQLLKRAFKAVTHYIAAVAASESGELLSAQHKSRLLHAPHQK